MTGFHHVGDQVLARYRDCAGMDQIAIDWLISQGVPAAAISASEVPATASGAFIEDPRFLFADEQQGDEHLVKVLVFVQFDGDGCPCDLIAWHPRSDALATWLGRTGHLGDADGPRLHEHGALPVWPDVLGWLRAGRDGVVIIDPKQARHELIGPFLAMGGLSHARALLSSLATTPRVYVAQADRQEAA